MAALLLALLLLCMEPLQGNRAGRALFNTKATDEIAHTLMTSFWNWHLQEFPEFATEAEVSDYDDKVTEYTEEAFQRRVRNATYFLSAIHELGNHGDVSGRTRESLIVMEDMLNTFIEGFEFRFQTVYLPAQVGFCPLKNWQFILSRLRLRSADDYEKLLHRYTLIPTQIQQLIDLTEEAMKRGYVRNTDGLSSSLNSLQKHIGRAEDSIFLRPFLHKNTSLPASAMEAFRDRAVTIVKAKIMPKLWKYWHYMTKKYLPAADNVPIGMYALPDGRSLYRRYLKYHLSDRMTPRQVHQIGIAEVKSVKDSIMKLVGETENTTWWSWLSPGDIMRRLMNDSQLYFKDSFSMVTEYQAAGRLIHEKLGDILLRIPDVPYKIQRSSSGPQGTYMDPSWSTQGAGIFYANVGPPYGPSINLVPLLLHELEPGHHTQASYLIDSRDPLPMFRRKLDFTNSFAVPFHFPLYNAYAEGWALYAEHLGEEMGLFKEPLARIGHYNNNILRACRLVVDTGIHAFGWSRLRAEDYLIQNTGLTPELVKHEVERYIAKPGQACAYKIGERKIMEIRRTAEAHLGEQFDIRLFHDRILSLGPVPLQLLEETMYGWMADIRGTDHPYNITPVSAGHVTIIHKPLYFGIWTIISILLYARV